jgi:sugar phosphate permease
MGAVSIFAGIPGFIISGWVVDRWFAAGCTDAHQRYYAYVNLAAAVLALVIFAYAPSVTIVILGWGVITLLQPFTGPSAAQLQIVTPHHLRGRVSAIYVMVSDLANSLGIELLYLPTIHLISILSSGLGNSPKELLVLNLLQGFHAFQTGHFILPGANSHHP